LSINFASSFFNPDYIGYISTKLKLNKMKNFLLISFLAFATIVTYGQDVQYVAQSGHTTHVMGFQSSSKVISSNHVWVCNDCGKVQVRENEPYDRTTCPETRWGGIGGAGNIFDDGDHNYKDLGYSGSNQYVCSRCHIAVMLEKAPSYPGTCGASGSNCCNHNWVKN
jgi:hypothetical protein